MTSSSAPATPPRAARLAGVLALVCALAAGALAASYALTRDAIVRQEEEARVGSLRTVFFTQTDTGGALTLRAEPLRDDPPVFALFRQGDDRPAYHAALGRGTGYNTGSPIELMAGFTNPGHPDDARTLLAGYVPEDRLPPAGARGAYLVGFQVVKSEETPGLGEKIKDRRPAYTWAEKLSGRAGEPGADRATDFQIQFRGRLAADLAAGRTVDAITAATITTNGVIAAVRDAAARLADALAAPAAGPRPAPAKETETKAQETGTSPVEPAARPEATTAATQAADPNRKSEEAEAGDQD